MSIQRWKPIPAWFDGAMQAHSDGEYVTYADHVAAVAEAERQANLDLADESAAQYDKGVSDERARIRAAVEALMTWNHEGLHTFLCVSEPAVLAVIDGEGTA